MTVLIGDSDWLHLLVTVLIGDNDLVAPDCYQLVPIFLVTVLGDRY